MFVWVFILPLLVFIPLHLSVLTVHLANAPVLGWSEFAPLIVFAGALLLVYTALRMLKYNGTPSVPAVILTLCGIGLALQFRIGSGSLQLLSATSPSQLAFPIGLAVMIVVYLLGRHGRISKLEPLWPLFLALSILVIGFVIVAGRKYRGAVYLPGNFNPVEIVKPMLIIFIASMLSGHRKKLTRGFLGIPLPPINIIVTVGILWAPPMIMLLLQGDMGMFALMNTTLLVMLYAVTSRHAYLLGGFTALVFLARILIPLSTRGRARLSAWLDPFNAATASGWQSLQALVALYTGGLLGTGLGAGSPNVVPIVESDFAYIILGEELGIIGCICVILLYIVLIISGTRIAERASDSYRSAVATGITACLGIQILLNIGGVVKAIPLTGIPLPLISHGGSSLVTTLLMAGILLAISDEKPTSIKKRRPKKTASIPSDLLPDDEDDVSEP